MSVKTITCKLKTDETANAILAQTRHVFAQACNQLSEIAWQESIFRQFPLHDRAYHAVRATFPTLPSQLIVRAIRVVTDSYKTDKSVQHTFSERSAVVFDARCLKLKGTASAILTTTAGRLTLPLAHGARQRQALQDATIGEADLLYRDGTYYLALAVKTPDPPLKEVTGVLGVDLGIAHIATDSSGEAFTGEVVKAVRRKCRRLRSSLQRKGTRSAKRHLQRIRRRQRHFVSTLNHQIAKRIVQKALSSAKAIALETLTGIRERGDGFSREVRWLLGNWSFDHPPKVGTRQQKIMYKAREAGLPVVWVDPAYTSQTCSACGHCERSNRKSQSLFECKRCAFVFNADMNAALNIEARGLVVNSPIVASRPAI